MQIIFSSYPQKYIDGSEWLACDLNNSFCNLHLPLLQVVMGRTSFYRTSNELEHHFLNIEGTRTRTCSSKYWWSNSNTLFLACNKRTLNMKPNKVFTWFIKLLIELTRTSFFLTSNEPERVHLFLIEIQHPIFGFE